MIGSPKKFQFIILNEEDTKASLQRMNMEQSDKFILVYSININLRIFTLEDCINRPALQLIHFTPCERCMIYCTELHLLIELALVQLNRAEFHDRL